MISGTQMPSTQITAVQAANWLFQTNGLISNHLFQFLREEEWLVCRAVCSVWFTAYRANYWGKINRNLETLIPHLFQVVTGNSEGRAEGHWFVVTTSPFGSTFLTLTYHDCTQPVSLTKSPVKGSFLKMEFIMRAHSWKGPKVEKAFPKVTCNKILGQENHRVTRKILLEHCFNFLNKKANIFWQKARDTKQLALWKSEYTTEDLNILENQLSCNTPQPWAYWMVGHPIYKKYKERKEGTKREGKVKDVSS